MPGPLPNHLRIPDPARLAPDAPARAEILAAHEAAMARGDAGYLDPASGLLVMTAAYLWAQGACCESGCRHCPFRGDEPPE